MEPSNFPQQHFKEEQVRQIAIHIVNRLPTGSIGPGRKLQYSAVPNPLPTALRFSFAVLRAVR
jgi:hypothetical protein